MKSIYLKKRKIAYIYITEEKKERGLFNNKKKKKSIEMGGKVYLIQKCILYFIVF
jgi:hypothetical protein